MLEKIGVPVSSRGPSEEPPGIEPW